MIYAAWALLAGMGLPIQVALNHLVAKGLSALWSAVISFVVGTVALLVVLFITRQPTLNSQLLFAVPWYAWGAGLLGAFYVTAAIVTAPIIGAATLVTLVVSGQLLASMLIDHYGFAGFEQQPISLGRVAGALLMVAGVLLIKKF